MSIPLVRRALIATTITLAAAACGSSAGSPDSSPVEGLPIADPGIETPSLEGTCLAGEPRCGDLGAADEPLTPIDTEPLFVEGIVAG